MEKKYWIWSTSNENWRILREKNVWASRSRRWTYKVQKGDEIIFYVRGTNCFMGIFEVVSDWYENQELIWTDEETERKKRYPFEVKIKPVAIGKVNFWELVPKFNFIPKEKKNDRRAIAFYLQGPGPGNYGKPISQEDYLLIRRLMREHVKKQVFIAPSSSEHVNRNVIRDDIVRQSKELLSIEGLIPISLVSNALSSKEKRQLQELFSDGKIRIWGTAESNKSTWDSINPGDYVLFYKRGRYVYCAEIVLKMDNEKLAKTIWGEYENGETWSLVFFVKNIRPIQISREKFNMIAGYDADFIPQAFMRVNDDAAKKIIAEIIKKKYKPLKLDIGGILNSLIQQEPEFQKVIKSTFAHLIAGKNVIFYGPPATSKTYLAKKICEYVCGKDNFMIDTANAEWSYFDVVGGRVPKEGGGTEFEEGIILKATEKCKQMLKEKGKPCWLIIDELNRANLDLAFGRIFTQMDIEYREEPLYLVRRNGAKYHYFMPLSFRILATMNTYDRSLLFSLGYAFMRRFAFIPVESLLKEPKEGEEPKELIVNEEMKELCNKQRMKKLKEKALSAVLNHFTMKNGEDRAFIFEEFELQSINNVIEIFRNLQVDGLDVLDLFLYISSKITNEGLVEIGHAIIFDAAKFIVAFYLLSPKDADVKTLLTEATLAYLFPQLEYFMPKLRKGKIFLEKEYQDTWKKVTRVFEELNLTLILEKLKEVEKEYRVIG